MAFPKEGNMAPAFSLLDQDGNKVNLKDFKGKKNVVLYFYPKAMTPGCITQACGIRDHKKEFEVEVSLRDQPVGRGKGSTKKEAEQNAAREALESEGFQFG